MSGHSKWATTKRQKQANDAKRSNLFSKLSKAISLAARDGGDPEVNFKLRMAIDRAKKFSLPKDNVERAIKSGTGEIADNQIEEITYEGFGPNGTALIIETITDNKNRTVSELKHLLSKNGGNLGNSGSVMWMFEQKGVIYLDKKSLSDEEELLIIDSGADDINQEDDGCVVYTKAKDLNDIKTKLEKQNFNINDSGLEYIPKETVLVDNKEKIEKLLELLDDHDDVQNIYTNADL